MLIYYPKHTHTCTLNVVKLVDIFLDNKPNMELLSPFLVDLTNSKLYMSKAMWDVNLYLSWPSDEEQRNNQHDAAERHPKHSIIMKHREVTWGEERGFAHRSRVIQRRKPSHRGLIDCMFCRLSLLTQRREKNDGRDEEAKDEAGDHNAGHHRAEPPPSHHQDHAPYNAYQSCQSQSDCRDRWRKCDCVQV